MNREFLFLSICDDGILQPKGISYKKENKLKSGHHQPFGCWPGWCDPILWLHIELPYHNANQQQQQKQIKKECAGQNSNGIKM